MKQSLSRRQFVQNTGLGLSALGLAQQVSSAQPNKKRPNIVWICVEDMSANMSCYGETTIETPNIDRLAREGTKFTQAFVTCPVCSPSRSAMVTGMYQTTIGAHNHRSSRHEVKITLPEHIKLIPTYFQEAGYYTSNGQMFPENPDKAPNRGKTDYNFEFDSNVYDGTDWRGRKPGQPFFAQFQLRGGKNRSAKVPNPVDSADVKLPPYYPDHPVLREDWARYLNSVIQTDIEVGRIVERLKEEGEYENTIIFFWTDHGISHVRDKQYMYEGGIHVPLIVRGPGVEAGTVINNLVEHIDIPASSLAMAGINVPEHIQGCQLFDSSKSPREYVFSARDRCDETVERIRCVRTDRFKYIRNYFPNKPHTQPNRYKDNKEIMITMRKLYEEGKLTQEQERPFLPTRPLEELYDLQADPYELNNLAGSPDHQDTLVDLRLKLMNWMEQTRDLGQIPEPELAEIARHYPSSFDILGDKKNQQLVEDLFFIRNLGDRGIEFLGVLIKAMDDERSTIRYVAAMELAKLGAVALPVKNLALEALKDSSPIVRVAAARIAGRLGMADKAVNVLVNQLRNAQNESVRHYAALELEALGKKAMPAYDALVQARKDNYEYVKRVSTRLVNTLDALKK